MKGRNQNLRKLTGLLLFTAVLMCCNATCFAFSVILDAGHGGKDYGAKGIKAYEKDINLAVVNMIADLLDKNYVDVDVLRTRKDDTFLTLKERADFANRNGGDLFVSIHVNSVDKKNRNRESISGASVYTLGLHKSEANLEVAKRENSVISLEDEYTVNYEGFDPNSAESYIIFEMGQNKHMGQSIALAEQIQRGLIKEAGRTDRGVRQAGFWVLWATGMPSVLVELDFICNPTQEKFLSSKSGQQKMAASIAKAIGTYAETHAGVEKTETVYSLEEASDLAEEDVNTDEPISPSQKETMPKGNTNSSKSSFHIQILASPRQIAKNSNELKGYKASFQKDGKWFKYYVGPYETQKAAQKELKEIKKKFPDAFVIEIKDGKIIRK